MTIDCKLLPRGIESIKMLTETFPRLCINYIEPQMHCSVSGPYSEIHAAVSYLMEFLEDFDVTRHEWFSPLQQSNCGSDSKNDQFKDSASYQHPGFHVSHIDSKSPEVQNDENMLPVNPDLEQWKSTNPQQANPDERIKDWIDSTNVEALSLIMEADIFAYLSTKSKEYRHILKNHCICVIDVTSEGITTLFLQSESKIRTRAEDENHIKQARNELSQLYQQLERNLRRAQIPKNVLGLRGGDTEAFKDLELLLPKVLLSFDESYVYLVGEMSEVSQAKQILLLGSVNKLETDLTAKKVISVSSDSPSESDRAGANTPKTSSYESGPKRRACEEYKLAARFKNSEMGLIGVCPKERCRAKEFRDLNSAMPSIFRPSPPPRPSLDTEGLANSDWTSQTKSHTGAGANQREDTLLWKLDPLQSTSSTLPPYTSSNVSSDLDEQIKNLVSTTGSTITSTSLLKRVNSFSGLPSPKQVNEENSKLIKRSGSITHSNRMAKSSSLCKDKTVELPSSKTVSGELIVPTIMWNYMKAAYHSDIKALISDLNLSASPTDKKEVVVFLKGADTFLVKDCQHQLQELVNRVASDFCVKQLKLVDLGMTEMDELLEECCFHIHSRFSKILIQSVKDILVFTGPKSLCSQATKMLKEVFQSELLNSGPRMYITNQDSIDHGLAKTTSCLVSPRHTSDVQELQVNCKNTEEKVSGNIKTYQSELSKAGSVPSHKPVVKEKLKKDEVTNLETSKVGTMERNSSSVSEKIRHERQKPSSLVTQKRTSAAIMTGKQTNCLGRSQHETCICGKSSLQVMRTSCGEFLCPLCSPVHAQCMKCSKAKTDKEALLEIPVHSLHRMDQNTENITGQAALKKLERECGIHGTMTMVELPVALPGHDRDLTAKITYCIPDGIQGVSYLYSGLFDLNLIAKGCF